MNKKKVFISQPMSGKREREIIEDRTKALEQLEKFGIYEKDIEIINTFIKDEPPENTNIRLWFLGKTIKMLANADLVIFIEGWDTAKGCIIEHKCAELYRIPMIIMDSNINITVIN